MKRVTGIGGIFFKAKDAPSLQAWYKRHLGIDVQGWGGAAFTWTDAEGKPVAGTTSEARPWLVTVTTADPSLNKGNPRLKLVGEHDYAVLGHLPELRALRDGGMAVSLLLLLGLITLAWRGRP